METKLNGVVMNGFARVNDEVETAEKANLVQNGDIVQKDKGSNETITYVVMKRQIGLGHSVAIIVGIIIGSGIFVSPVGILINVKSVGMSCVMWLICGVFSGLCALCYAELGACIPQSGGEYVYIKRAFGDFPAFICLWINFIIICPVCVAATSLVFATYLLKPFFPDCDPPMTALRLLAALVVSLAVGVNCISVKISTKMQSVITVSKLLALSTIIIIGFVYIGKGKVESFKDAFADSDFSAGSLAIGFYSGFWAYGGWSYLNFLTEELIEPHKNLPRAIIISITIVTGVYLITNIAYFAVLSPREILSSPAVAVTFAEQITPVFALIIPVLIAISVMGGINGISLSMSRLFMTGAKNNHLPRIMSMIHVEQLTPVPSLLVIMIISICMQSFEDIFCLIELVGFGFSLIFMCVFSGQIYLRYKEPKLPRPIKLPIALPIFLVLCSFAILVLTIHQKPKDAGLGLLLIGIGIPMYPIFAYWTKVPRQISKFTERATIILQKALFVCPNGDCQLSPICKSCKEILKICTCSKQDSTATMTTDVS